ncbi:MAG: hypothetical protein IRY92_05380 [Dactylosporangium sp.]|nr:hypothetical protein [Dactylosporangium sp.]
MAEMLTTSQITKIMESVDAAIADYRRGLAELKRNGRPIYAPEEERRRRQELKARLDAAFSAAKATLEAALTATEQALGETPTDPLLLLSAADLARAVSLREFIADDARRLPQEELARQARAAVERRDKAAAAVYLREIDRFIADARRRGKPFHHDLAAVAEALRGMFVDAKAQERLQAQRDAVSSALSSLGFKRYMAESYGPNTARAAAT